MLIALEAASKWQTLLQIPWTRTWIAFSQLAKDASRSSLWSFWSKKPKTHKCHLWWGCPRPQKNSDSPKKRHPWPTATRPVPSRSAFPTSRRTCPLRWLWRAPEKSAIAIFNWMSPSSTSIWWTRSKAVIKGNPSLKVKIQNRNRPEFLRRNQLRRKNRVKNKKNRKLFNLMKIIKLKFKNKTNKSHQRKM